MDHETCEVEEQMKETMAGLNDKFGRLEHQISGTVSSVKESVTNVRDTFDVKQHVRRRPWTLVGGAAALGFICGARRGGRFSRRPRPYRMGKQPIGPQYPVARAEAVQHAGVETPGWMSRLGTTFEPEIAELKGVVVGMLIGIARDIITKQTHNLSDSQSVEQGKNGR